MHDVFFFLLGQEDGVFFSFFGGFELFLEKEIVFRKSFLFSFFLFVVAAWLLLHS